MKKLIYLPFLGPLVAMILEIKFCDSGAIGFMFYHLFWILLVTGVL